MILKRTVAILLALCMLLTFAACTENGKNGEETGNNAVESNSNVGGGRTTTTGGGYVTNTRPQGVQGYVGQEVEIKKGNLRLIYTAPGKKRNWGGKTFTYATINSTASHLDMLAKFEKEYNVKIEWTAPGMEKYVEHIGAQKAAGTPYDIAYLYDTWFPSEITKGLLEPVDPYITTADLWDGKDPGQGGQGGFSKSHLQGLAWNNHAYAAAGGFHAGCVGLFYNKRMLQQAGQPDLLDLYYKGELNWEKLYEIGSKINNPSKGVYFINNFSDYYSGSFCISYNTDFAVISNGIVKENLSDKTLTTALQMFQKFTYGEGKLVDQTPKANENNGIDAFAKGTTACVMQWPDSWKTICDKIDGKAVAFGKSKANIGWCPLPEQSAAKKNVMGSSGGTAIGAGTSDPYVALTFAHWNSLYNIYGAYTEGMNADIKKISVALLNKDNYRSSISGFSSSAGSVQNIRTQICRAVSGGGDIASTLKAYKKQLQRVLDAATA